MPVKEIFPSAKSWNAFFTTFDFSSSISIPLVLGLLLYPYGALLGQTPFRSFWRLPLLTFSLKLST
ncbi:hypothetical protein A2699_02110 [Candidatus Gottesmanbacteria bacterium RIFCSPHIGHO2_01_FULL_43_15]|nr:MAG: hypothetical protein A2699_02110 [Candidatus Gottesmanbacteria bacterium RIFCSPHIGHO2_01_FULL_43_15]